MYILNKYIYVYVWFQINLQTVKSLGLFDNPLLHPVKNVKDITNSLKNIVNGGEKVAKDLGNDVHKFGERISSGLSNEADKVIIKLYL